MAFYLRKSVRIGPLKFNLSKSGIGISTGIKGFRIGAGPRGNYIHAGRNGFYYRQTISSNDNSSLHTSDRIQTPDHVEMKEIDSEDILKLVDSNSEDLVNEINGKLKKLSFFPFLTATSLFALLILSSQLTPTAFWLSLSATLPLLLFTFHYDKLRKTTVLLYDIDDDHLPSIQRLYEAFDGLRKIHSMWHIPSKGSVNDRKYHAGASTLVTRNKISISEKNPKFIKTNIPTPTIAVGKQSLIFLPDRLMIMEGKTVGAITYPNLKIRTRISLFIEEEQIPTDSKIVDRTWKYVNKKGGPDKRFKDNRELPIMEYEEIHLSSDQGVNELLLVSKFGAGSEFAKSIEEYMPLS